jgi:two-component system response regulator PilR (NtrC family)
METEPVIEVSSLPDSIRGTSPQFTSGIPADIPPEGINLENIVDGIEKDLLFKALEKSGWVKKHAAKLLHLSFRSFRYRLDKFEIEKQPDLEDE